MAPSLIRQGNNRNPAGRATVYGTGASDRSVTGTAPVTAYLGESGSPPLGYPAVEDRMMLAFQHLDLVLAIGAQGAEPRQPEEIGRMEGFRPTPPAGNREDPVIKRLSDALAATERVDTGGDTGICADALRLAIVTRLLGLQSETQRSGERPVRAKEACIERQMRALQKWRLKRVVEYVDNHLSGRITLLDLAAVAGLSRMHFASQFRAATGFRPHEYLLRRRIQRAEELLRQSSMTLVEIALTVGFQTQAHFTTVFKRFVGDTPYQWRNANCVGARRAK